MFSDMIYYNEDLHPKPMREYMPDWFKKIPNTDYPRTTTVQTCPSFLDVFKEGYVITTPVDVEIEVKEDGSFTWQTKTIFDIDALHTVRADFISAHNDVQMVNHLPKDSGIVKMLKMQFPMYVMTPPGYSCRQVPMSYMFEKNDDWESIYGVLKTDVINELNIQIAIKK